MRSPLDGGSAEVGRGKERAAIKKPGGDTVRFPKLLLTASAAAAAAEKYCTGRLSRTWEQGG